MHVSSVQSHCTQMDTARSLELCASALSPFVVSLSNHELAGIRTVGFKRPKIDNNHGGLERSLPWRSART